MLKQVLSGRICKFFSNRTYSFDGILSNQTIFCRVYYRKTVPAEQPIQPSTPPYERSSPPRRSRRTTPPSPSPPPIPSRSRSHHQSSSRYPRPKSPIRSSRPPRRPYSPYIPLPPDLVEYTSKTSSRHQQRSSPSSPIAHHQRKQSSRQKRSRSANGHRSTSRSSTTSQQTSSDQEPTRTLFVDNLERDITESKLRELFARYGTIEDRRKSQTKIFFKGKIFFLVLVDFKKSSSKRSCASIRYENLDMAYEARRAMNGQMIGKTECKIGYGV